MNSLINGFTVHFLDRFGFAHHIYKKIVSDALRVELTASVCCRYELNVIFRLNEEFAGNDPRLWVRYPLFCIKLSLH